MVNHCAIVLTAKAPFIQWANGIDAAGPRYEECFVDEGPPVYLGPDADSLEEVMEFIRKDFDLFFEEQLEGWCTDPMLWPQERTYRMFTEWFAVRVHTIVIDTVDAPLEIELSVRLIAERQRSGGLKVWPR
jgi:hypothetical protein